MKTIITIISLGIATSLAIAQSNLKVYKTYEDFLNDKGEECTFKKIYWPSAVGIGVVAKKGDEKVKINSKNAWGYKFKEALFRFDRAHNQPVRVVSVGKIVYYENGQANMEMVEKESEYGSYKYGYQCYVSKNLNTDIVPLDTYILSDTKSKVAIFKKEHPEYNELFDCLGKRYEYKKARTCVTEFEKD